MALPKVRGLGLKANGPFWANYLRRIVIPEVVVLRETVLDRALPSFDNIDDEAERAGEEALERLGRHFHPDDDPADYYEAARDESILYYDLRRSARQAVLNLFAVALHHLLEQKLLFLLRKELLPKEHENDHALLRGSNIVKAFGAQGLDLKDFPEWSKIEELRHVANATKHADGAATESLWKVRPDLFLPDALKNDPSSPLGKIKTAVHAPLSGEDLFVSPLDLGDYFDQVDAFLNRLADEMESLAE